MILELNHIAVRTSQADKTIDFYTDLLGGRVLNEAYIPSTETRCIYMHIAGSLVEFLCPANPPSTIKFGLDHFAYLVDDLDSTYQKLVDAGVPFSITPRAAGSGRGRVAFMYDPNGVKVELVEREDSYRIAPIDGPVKSIDHLSLVANDLTAAEHFYTNLLEMKPLKKFYIPATELTISYLNTGVDVIELLHRPTSNPTNDLIGHIAMRVDNVDEMTAQLKAKGVEFLEGFPREASTGDGRLSVFKAPDGVKIELVDRNDLRDL